MKNLNHMIALCVILSRVVNNLIILPTYRLDKMAKYVTEFPQRTPMKKTCFKTRNNDSNLHFMKIP